MKKLLLSLTALLPLACNQPMEQKAPTEATATTTASAGNLQILPDVVQRAAQLPKTVIDYDRALLNDNERQVVDKLIEASKFIDEIYWLQVSEDNPALREQLAKGTSTLERAGYDYFLINRGPWDRLKEDEPFIGTARKPAGAAFYPPDITTEEM